MTQQSMNSWLVTDVPDSEFHAQCQRYWLGWLSFKSNPIAMIGFYIILALFAVALFAPLITSGQGLEQDLANRLKRPNAGHWLGTDELGRDVYQRIVWGARITLQLVGLVTIVTIPIGVIVGVVSGFFGGWLDSILMRITDIFLAFPKLILALAFVAALGPGLLNAVLAISLTAWAPYARIVRAETLAIRGAEYVTAAQLQGASNIRVLWLYITPLTLSTVIVRLALDMGCSDLGCRCSRIPWIRCAATDARMGRYGLDRAAVYL